MSVQSLYSIRSANQQPVVVIAGRVVIALRDYTCWHQWQIELTNLEMIKSMHVTQR